jgi:hypothetical protein
VRGRPHSCHGELPLLCSTPANFPSCMYPKLNERKQSPYSSKMLPTCLVMLISETEPLASALYEAYNPPEERQGGGKPAAAASRTRDI